jgi:hypothetical protein
MNILFLREEKTRCSWRNMNAQEMRKGTKINHGKLIKKVLDDEL